MPGIGKNRIGRKIAKLRGEGKSASQAAGQAFGQARAGDLGPAAESAARRGKRRKVRIRRGSRGVEPPKKRLEQDRAAVQEYTRGS